jgi:hypothetical protein
LTFYPILLDISYTTQHVSQAHSSPRPRWRPQPVSSPPPPIARTHTNLLSLSWKVVLLLKELNIPYEHKLWDFPDLKKPEYEKLCPNGRTPTIEDPNTGITLWESGAILEYLIEEYDKENKFTYTSSPEKYQLKQW